MESLKEKSVVVTGGSRGFGRGIVTALASQGARITVIGRNPESLEILKREVPGNIETIRGDISDQLLAARVISEKRPQVLILNAGARGISRPTRFQTWETFSIQHQVDFKSTFIWVREALLLPLEKESTILVGSSGAALANFQLVAGYASAKAAQWAFARCVADEARGLGIRVQCLMPVMSAETEMGHEGMMDFQCYLPEQAMHARRSTENGPGLTPAFLGEAVLNILTNPEWSEELGLKITGDNIIPIK